MAEPAESALPADPSARKASESAEEELQRVVGSLRLRVFLVLVVAILAVLASGALLLLAPQELMLLLVPVLLVVEFGCGFLLSGKLMALALARHHDRLRGELLQQQEQTRQLLVARWMSLDSTERGRLRERFPDIDWGMIDGLAGTAGEAETKH